MFDACLKEQGIIRNKDFSVVHELIAKDFYAQVPLNQMLIDSDINVKEIRAWIKRIGYLKDEKTLTDYLRVTLGHLLADILLENYLFETHVKFLERALLIYKSKGYAERKFGIHEETCTLYVLNDPDKIASDALIKK
jgi:hypothetical protein